MLQPWNPTRVECAKRYNNLLRGTGDLILPAVAQYATHVYHIYMIRTARRDGLMEYLNKHGIGTLIHYPVPPHLQNAYSPLNYKPGAFPLAEIIKPA